MPSYNALSSELAATNTLLQQTITRLANDEALIAANTQAIKDLAMQLGFDEAKIATLMSAPAPTPVVTSQPGLLFSSGFGASVALAAPSGFYGGGAWQDIIGTDNLTGFAWPPNIGVASTTHFQLGVAAPVDATTINNYMLNQIQSVIGRKGTQTSVLGSMILQSGTTGTNPQGGGATQDTLLIQPVAEPGDLYISYWLKLQPDLANLMGVGQVGTGWNWRSVFEIKTAGDFRFICEIKRDPYINGGNLFWSFKYDNEANGGLPYQSFWSENNTAVAVPINQWMKVETFWHRSSANDGRWWMAINGQVLVDHYGPNMGVNNAAINRIYMALLYSSTAYPIFQWVDDLEIWDGFPPASGSNPPYGAH